MLPPVPSTTEKQRQHSSYAGLNFIKAAFCPLEFNAMKLATHPLYRKLRKDDALGTLDVGEALHYPRQFPYTDRHGNRRTGTQIVTAPFGLAPVDFDLFIGLFTYLKRLPELPEDGVLHVTVDFLAKTVKLPATCQEDYGRMRSRIFRFAYAKYTNTAFWNSQNQSYDIVNFGFWNVTSLSKLTESRRPVELHLDQTFLRLLKQGPSLALDYELWILPETSRRTIGRTSPSSRSK
jgi:hypothetical protein